MKLVGLIPLRGGSKSIPFKNIKKLAGKPLFYWSAKAALDSKIFSEIHVSTDCPKIKQQVSKELPELRIIDRPPEFATDTASSESVMLHAASILEYDVLSLIQVTSPLVSSSDFHNAWKAFKENDADSLVTGVISKRFFWDQKTKLPLNYDHLNRPRRQDFDGIFMENGAFYFTKKDILVAHQNRLGGKIETYAMSEENSVEIDEPRDWAIVAELIQEPKYQDFAKIKCVICDVDGTLTDGGMYYHKDGEFGKKFHTQDWHGLNKIKSQAGILRGIMTAEDSPAVKARLEKVKLDFAYHGAKNKPELLKEICDKFNLTLDQIAFIGDDDGDLECIRTVGLGACPSDASDEVLNTANYICKKPGGFGAVRELCDKLLSDRLD